jgi:CRP-like cAMP-binding protein
MPYDPAVGEDERGVDAVDDFFTGRGKGVPRGPIRAALPVVGADLAEFDHEIAGVADQHFPHRADLGGVEVAERRIGEPRVVGIAGLHAAEVEVLETRVEPGDQNFVWMHNGFKMNTLLYKNLQTRSNITPAAFERIERVVTERKLKKKEWLLREGEVCTTVAFVNRGCLRSFSVDARGSERVWQLATEDHWIADLYSFTTQKPSELTIEALEASDVLLLHHRDVEPLLREIPALETYFRKLYQNAYVATQQRLNAAYSASAEERYRELIEHQPQIIRRVPLLHIASYLGITPESLSRIRRQLARE